MRVLVGSNVLDSCSQFRITSCAKELNYARADVFRLKIYDKKRELITKRSMLTVVGTRIAMVLGCDPSMCTLLKSKMSASHKHGLTRVELSILNPDIKRLPRMKQEIEMLLQNIVTVLNSD